MLNLLWWISMYAYILAPQEKDTFTTVLLSSIATPQTLESLINDVSTEGILIEIADIKWNEHLSQIEKMDLTIQFKKGDGSWSDRTSYSFSRNILTEGTLLFLQIGGKHPYQILGHYQQLLIAEEDISDLPDIVFQNDSEENMVYTSFSKPFAASDRDKKNLAIRTITQRLEENNELIATLLKERDPGLTKYTYRYYFNQKRLAGSLGINYLDMQSKASIKNDADGVLSLFVETETELSPFAAFH